jgi:hypothetical protein
MDVFVLVLVFACGAAAFALLTTGWVRMARRAHALSTRSAFLRDRFGCEYARAVALEGRFEGELVLLARLMRFGGCEHPPLDACVRDRYADEWQAVQAQFASDPRSAIRAAEALEMSMLEARRYPVDPWSRFDALSVTAPVIAMASRHANHAFCLADHGCVLTDEIVIAAAGCYRQVFEHMLETSKDDRGRSRREVEEARLYVRPDLVGR